MPGTAVTTGAPQIKVDGSRLKADVSRSLIGLHVSRSMGAVSHAMLRFRDVHTASAAFNVGDRIEVSAADDTASTSSLFIGEVLSLGIEVLPGATELIVEAFDASHRLGSTEMATSHQEVSMSDVIRKIASEAGLTAKIDGALAKPKFEHVQQSGTTHQYLNEVTRAFGCEWFVDNKTLVVRPRQGGRAVAKMSGQSDLLYFSARLSAVEQARKVEIRGWDVSQKKAITSTGAKPEHHRSVPVENKAKGAVKADAAVAPNPLFVGAAAKTVATGSANRLASSMLTGRGEVNVDARLAPGVLVEIDDVAPDWNGTYYVTAVDHHFGIGQSFISRFTVGPLEPTSLVDLLGTAPISHSARIAQGLTVGIVTDNGDKEKLNRVKVQLPYLSDESVTDWCRVATLGAGKDWGWSIVPDVGDEVLVGFEHGDLQRPYVLGSLWNGKDKPPSDAVVDEKDRNVVRSFTTPTGHVLKFSDGKKPEERFVSITTKKSELLVGEEKIELITNEDMPITIKNKDGSVTLDKGGKLTIKAKSITLDAEQELKLSGQKVTVKAKTEVNVEGKSGLKLKSGGLGSLESSGSMKVKGAMVNIN